MLVILFAYGIIIVLDLDRFEEYTVEHGYDQYKPNIVTGTLTNLVKNLVYKYNGSVIYGLDEERGTEEAIIEIPYFPDEKIDELKKDLEKIKDEINKLGASISIVVVKDYVTGKPARSRREAYRGTPGRRKALRILRKVKRRGGNRIYVEV